MSDSDSSETVRRDYGQWISGACTDVPEADLLSRHSEGWTLSSGQPHGIWSASRETPDGHGSRHVYAHSPSELCVKLCVIEAGAA